MRIFALGDLHLSHAQDKPMDCFGSNWYRHPERIMAQWTKVVQADDLVLIPGDISWAMHLEDTREDFAFIDALPGKKLLLRGNHDYWWSSLTKIRAVLPKSMYAIQNDAFHLDGLSIGGTRFWHTGGDAQDKKICARELGRLKLSLDALRAGNEKLVMLHYPPAGEEIFELLESYGVKTVVYGHLHGAAHRFAFEGERNGVTYHLVSADYLDFCPKFIMEL